MSDHVLLLHVVIGHITLQCIPLMSDHLLLLHVVIGHITL